MRVGLFTISVAAGIIALSCNTYRRVEVTPGQHPRSFRGQITKAVALEYLLFLPQDYGRDLEKMWPLMLFLHGAGERGDRLELVKKHGPPQAGRTAARFPFYRGLTPVPGRVVVA